MVALAAVLFAYSFTTEPIRYDVAVEFDGYLPVLGGKNGVAKVQMAVDVVAATPKNNALFGATSEIKDIAISLNNAKLPVTVQAIQPFFPKTTIEFTPQGKITWNNAPDVQLPARLPGLDAKRFADISFMPIEFPTAGIEVNHEFSFNKRFGESDITYTVMPSEITTETINLSISVKQKYSSFEDDGRNLVKEEVATHRIDTVVDGHGKAVFLTQKGCLQSIEMIADSVSDVTNIESGEQSRRNLKTILRTVLAAKK